MALQAHALRSPLEEESFAIGLRVKMAVLDHSGVGLKIIGLDKALSRL